MSVVPSSAGRILLLPALDSRVQMCETEAAADLLENLSLESQSKVADISDHVKKSTDGYGASDLTNNPANQLPRSASPFHSNPTPCYFPNPYYYGGYDGHGNDWNDYGRSVTPDVVEIQHGMFRDSDAAMFSQGYGYPPVGSYMLAPDSYLQGMQQYPASHNTLHSSSHVGSLPREIQAPATGDKVPSGVGMATGANAGGLSKNHGKPFNTSIQNSFSKSGAPYKNGGGTTIYHPPSSYQDLWPGYGGFQSFPWLDAHMLSNGTSKHGSGGGFSSGLNPQSTRPTSAFGIGAGYMMYPPNGMYGPYGNGAAGGFGSFGSNSWINGHGWMVVDNKYKSKSRGHGNENIDGLSELNRGPRAKSFKNHKEVATGSEAVVEGQNVPSIETNKEKFEQYNREDFKEDYAEAKFFVIKSYSEDDVHKSIKYGVWTSTLNGNKKLDAAYLEAQANPGGCPVFLLFSVNMSGQFVGLAEMIDRVDFDKTVEHWQQEKWKGCFPVKWHIVKDIPNSSLRHITLEYNENKPVTNSRDTQEVDNEKGIQILKNFKRWVVRTSILDDFGFYAARERVMQERRARQRTQRQLSEDKSSDNVIPNEAALKHAAKDGSNGVAEVAHVDVKLVLGSPETEATTANVVGSDC